MCVIEPVWVPTDTKATVTLHLLTLSQWRLVFLLGCRGAEECTNHGNKPQMILNFASQQVTKVNIHVLNINIGDF